MGYLNEVFNTYYESKDNKQKHNIKEGFKKIVWSTLPYTKLDRHFSYMVSYNNIDDESVIKIFEKYRYMEYKLLKSRYNINKLDKEDLIKARINSNYGKYFDKEVYLKKEYYRALAQYKNIYYNYLKGEVEELESEVSVNDEIVKRFKEESLQRKNDMTWSYYKSFVNMCLDKIFENYIPIDEKIKVAEFKPNHILDWDEDNYILVYVNKSLNGYLKNYINETRGKRKQKKYKKCACCQKLIEIKSNKTKYCETCAKKFGLERYKKYNEKRNKIKVTTNRKTSLDVDITSLEGN